MTTDWSREATAATSSGFNPSLLEPSTTHALDNLGTFEHDEFLDPLNGEEFYLNAVLGLGDDPTAYQPPPSSFDFGPDRIIPPALVEPFDHAPHPAAWASDLDSGLALTPLFIEHPLQHYEPSSQLAADALLGPAIPRYLPNLQPDRPEVGQLAGRKRTIDEVNPEESPSPSATAPAPHRPKVRLQSPRAPSFVDLFANPSDPVESLTQDLVKLDLANPFLAGSTDRFSRVKRSKVFVQAADVVDSYLKIELRPSTHRSHEGIIASPDSGIVVPPRRSMFVRRHRKGDPSSRIPYLPTAFGQATTLDRTDQKLFTFYTEAWCAGRSLLPSDNAMLIDYAPLMGTTPSLKYAILALSALYVLDYSWNLPLQRRADSYYAHAIASLESDLRNPSTFSAEGEHGVVGAIYILLSHDMVDYEAQRPRGEKAQWLEGAQLAKKILDASDPGNRYYKSENVQQGRARENNANKIAFVLILAELLQPLEVEWDDRKLYVWLLAGTKRNAHRIQGGTGISAKLMHLLAVITQLSARAVANPGLTSYSLTIKRLERRLAAFSQWSDLSPGHPTPFVLLSTLLLDSNGKATTPAAVLDLIGASWVATCQVYLQVRFHRKPRAHPDVLAPLRTLMECVRRMPFSGPLFTAQAPFGAIFIMGLIAKGEDRGLAREWFETVVSRSGCRSSVPPVWQALKGLWVWMDESDIDASGPDGERVAWWELMVAHLNETVGQVSLE